MDVLDELIAFKARFDRKVLEETLLAHASSQGMVALDDVVRASREPNAPALAVARGATPIAPRAALELRTLGQVDALTRKGSTVAVAAPKAEPLGQALAWRLARLEGERYELLTATLTGRSATAAESDRERQVAQARRVWLEANRAYKVATGRHAKATELHEMRVKWKAPWKSIQRADDNRKEAEAELQAAVEARDSTRARYDQLSKTAQAFRGGDGPAGEHGAVEVVVVDLDSKKHHKLLIAAPMDVREAPLPSLQNVGFPVAKESGLWRELKGRSVDESIAWLEQRFSWHYAHTEVGGVKVGGMTLLQLAPLLLVALFPLLIRRSRRLSDSYNPFGTTAPGELPRVGFGGVVPNLLVLVVLPALASGLCVWSLLEIEHVPLIPILCALAVIGLGSWSLAALGDLLDLRDAIVRSTSERPPLPPAGS